jgi:hypothetical protein
MEDEAESTQSLDAVMLTPLARKASGRENLRLEGWQVETISGGAEGSIVQRISGVGQADGQAVPWSLISKTIVAGPANSASLQASHYWKREPNYYQSGLLANLPGGLRAARCYGWVDQADRCQLFLEDLQAAVSGMTWTVDYYLTVARCLGQFNGEYLAGRLIPTAEWIPRQWMRAYLEEGAAHIDLFFRSLENPILKRSFRTIPSALIRTAWDQRHAILDALDQLPQTFCHQDAFCRNLYSELTPGGDRLVPIDWSYAGPAALGAELVPLVLAGFGLGSIPISEGSRLAQLALEGYLKGLGDAGWRGDPDLVRFGFSVGSFYRYPI